MRKETLLRLLLLGDGLETAGDWRTAVEGGDESEGGVDTSAQGGEGEGVHAPLMVAVEEIIPYLPDYSAVSSKLKGLLGYATKAYPGEVDRLVQGWLQRTPTYGLSFRRWVLCDWLKCSHLTSADPSALVQWRYVLFVAATNETVTMLKRALQGYIDAVDAALEEDQFDGESDETSTLVHSIETVEDLLDFYWMHAEQLASCSLLCAAKLHALAVRTQRSASKLAEDDEVLVRLRWSLMLKPLLFKPLLQHAIALKVLPGKMKASQTWTSNELTDAVALVDRARRERIQMELKASREELERAFTSGVKHVHVSASNPMEGSLAEASIAKYVESISADKRKLLLAELERELDDAPPHLFPHVFALFGLIVSGLLSSADGSELLVDAVDTLFALFDRRIHDPASCLDTLGLVLRLSIARHPLWHDNATFYLKTAETLSETATLQVEPKVKWAARMALQQLLFECDVQLLHSSQTNLRHLLPPSTMRFVSIRLGS